MAQVAKTCDACKKRNSSFWCEDCREEYCKTCCYIHNRFPEHKTRAHIILNIENVCKDHKYEHSRFCTTCGSFVCKVCVRGKHKQHYIDTIQKVASDYQENLFEIATEVVDNLNSVSKLRESMQSEQNKSLSTIKQFREDANKCNNKVKRIVKTVLDEYIGITTEFENSGEDAYEKTLNRIKNFEDTQSALHSKLKEVWKEKQHILFITLFLKIKENIQENQTIPCPTKRMKLVPFNQNDMVSTVMERITSEFKTKEQHSLSEQMKNDIKTLQKENKMLLQDNEKLRKDTERLEKDEKEKRKLTKILQEKEEELSLLNQNLKIRKNEVAGISNQIAELEKRNHDLEDQIKRFPAKDTQFENTERLLKEANATIQTLKDEHDRIQAKYKLFKDINDQLTDQIQCLTEENESISKILKLPEGKTKKMVTELQKELNEEVNQRDKLSQMCDKYEAAYKKLQITNQTQEERLANMHRPQTAPNRQYREMQTMVETLKVENESLMQRLSKVAGMKMKDNSQYIPDLSDPNRPEKLSEKFREIYDNAWTDLVDAITEKTGESDDICVKQIVRAQMMMYDTCKNTITNNKREIAKLVGYPEDYFDKPYAGGTEGHDPVLKTLKDLIQVSVIRQSVAVTKNIKQFPEIKTILQVGGKNGDAFITECLQLCLYMCIHDPPVVLDFSCKSGDAFNKDKFTPFTKSGAIVDYLVWPVMYLSDNGAIMSKGIAQGKKI